MTKAKLLKKLPLLLVAAGIVTGLSGATFTTANAEVGSTGVTKMIDVDPGFLIREVVYINGQEAADSDIKIADGKVFLPLELVSEKMGDRLEGDISDAYFIRKSDRMIVIMPGDKSYKLNGEVNNLDCKVEDNKVFVTLDFIKDVLAYKIETDGNVHYIGTENTNSSTALDGSAMDSIMIAPEVFINGTQFPEFGVTVQNGKIFLPLETICEKMGDRLEGDADAEYYLRTNDKMLIVIPAENKYILNGKENTFESTIKNGSVCASLDFFKDVLGYEVKEEGNSFYLGQVPEKEVLANTVPGGVWSLENGTWYYLNGAHKVNGWVRDNNIWYYMNEEGKMQTGWVKVNEKWYYLNASGAMQTGWINDGNEYYYLNENGDMAESTTVDGFRLAENGMCSILY